VALSFFVISAHSLHTHHHQIDNDLHAAELHIVHKSTVDDTLAVVGMFMDPKSAENNEEFDKILRGWEEYAEETATICAAKNIVNETTTITAEEDTTTNNSTAAALDEGARDRRHYDRRRLEAFNPYSLMAPGSGFYHYDGSLTTPPCSEIVSWSLSDTPVKISVYQYNLLTSLVLEYVDRETCQMATIATKSGTSSRPQQPLNGRSVKRICPLSDKPSSTSDADASAGSSSSSSSAATANKATTTFAESAAASIATYFMLGAAAALF
jgi:carbonic anhydrase